MINAIAKKSRLSLQPIATLVAVLVAVIFLSLSLSFKFNTKKASAAGNFSTQNGKIYDPDGKEFIPIGNNEWGPAVNYLGGYDSNVADKANIYADVLNFNTIRLGVCASGDTCYDDPGQGNSYSATPVSEQTLQKLDTIINAFTAKKVVVILANFEFSGCHGFSDQWVYKVHNLNRAYAQRYKNNPYVWINILNEPNQDPDGITDAQWDMLTNNGIDTIRGEGNQNMIVIDGPTECSSEDIAETSFSAANSRLYSQASSIISRAGGNVVADVHTYFLGANFKNATPDEAGQRLADFAGKLRNDKSMPLIIGEFPPAIDETRTFRAFQWQGVDYYMRYGDLNKAVYKAAITANLGVLSWAPAGGSEPEMYLLFPSRQWWTINKTDGTKPTNLTYGGGMMWDLSHDPDYVGGGSITPPPPSSAPTINSFTTQSDTAHAQDTILLVANVTDPDNDINKVDLELDGTVISSKSSSQASGDNYSFSFDTTTKSNGTYTLKAKAYDSANPTHSAEKTLTITIDNQTTPPPDTEPPVIQTLISSNGSDPAQGTIQIQAQNVTDPDGTISKIELYLDNETTPYNLSSNCSVTGCKNPQYPADASGSNYTFKLDTTKLTNGSHTFKVKVYDSADPAHSAEKTLTTTIDNTTNPDPDTTKPTITSTEPAAGSNTTVTSTLTIKANGVSDDSGEMGEVSYRITGNNIDQTHPLTSSSNDGNYSAEMNIKTLNIPDGNYTITVIAKDAAGNTSDIKTFTITVNNTTNPDPDTTKPTITTTEPAAGSTTTVTGTLTIKANGVSDDKAVDKVIYRIDNATTEYPLSSSSNDANYSATLNTATLNNGTHTITVIAKDAAGNTSDIKTFTITVNNTTNPDPDTTKPTITSTEPAAGSTTTVTGTLTIKANGVSDDKAVASVGYTIDGGSLKPMSVFTSSSYSASLGSNYSATIDTTTLNNGDHTIVISAKDTSNNTSDLKTFTIKVSNSNSNNNNNNSGSGSNTSNNTANQNPTNVPVVFPPQTGVNILGATLQQTDYYINDEFIGSKLGQENLSISDVIFNTRKLQPGDYDLKTIGKYTDGTVNVTSKIVRVFSKSLLGKYQAPVLTSLAVLSLASGASYITHNHRQKAKKASR
jgi:hypothetical protein